ncbi:peptide/nickel transport system ATP-binding protein [Saccharopolyspora antimicrobica]|uniref:Peptide/nickel transport system ATP-binding protein n=1 Tax=Saccharopolyspora antimicrobica TaxID=455193 RepID=A0A1I4U8H1_9PSEU|nr:ABC transporter ATP-binding protein [Saccharopolyspora antimicrobica]RKT88735.1 peptide/nickel transport system ATP-binding protein [Saccharopolyspora antimicrobica]SFM85272.1 peptide/nickel transport system ATP-binding protein [Saccharopolyspora antimicrobica]
MTAVVSVRNLTVTAGDRAIVSGVSFDLAEGGITALVGESGSGKTTTALSLLGEKPPGAEISGRIEVTGETVDPARPPATGTIGYIPQHPSAALNPVRRIGPVLREIARLHVRASSRRERRELVRQRVVEALRQAQVPDGEQFLHRYPHQLSGGQQQRIVLAHQLIGRPRVLVADEPTTGQDAVIRAQLVEEFRSVAARGIAILLLTHDLDLVRALAGHVLVMNRGEVVETGPCEEVLSSPRHPCTRRLVDAQPDPEAAGRKVPEASDPVVSVRGLVAGHRRVDTVHDVSLEIHRGETLAVVGRSGSGKSTLARCLTGLHPHRGGEIRLDDTPLPPLLRQRTPEQLARVQYVFQDARASFNEFAPVLDQVARTAERLSGADRTEARRRARDELVRLGITEASASRRPAALSGGELQRAALVRAALARPDVLICDEITSGLDTTTQADLLDVLEEFQADTGCALVVITHDLAVVAGRSDRVVIVDGGRIVERGRTADVLAEPGHPVTKNLVAAAERFTARTRTRPH